MTRSRPRRGASRHGHPRGSGLEVELAPLLAEALSHRAARTRRAVLGGRTATPTASRGRCGCNRACTVAHLARRGRGRRRGPGRGRAAPRARRRQPLRRCVRALAHVLERVGRDRGRPRATRHTSGTHQGERRRRRGDRVVAPRVTTVAQSYRPAGGHRRAGRWTDGHTAAPGFAGGPGRRDHHRGFDRALEAAVRSREGRSGDGAARSTPVALSVLRHGHEPGPDRGLQRATVELRPIPRCGATRAPHPRSARGATPRPSARSSPSRSRRDCAAA